ncbi:MAG: universal stress protein [Desulfatiglandales bacterium]
MKKILCALDGTERSFETVKYISSLPMAKGCEITLFSVFEEVPEAYWDLGNIANVKNRVKGVKAWSVNRKNELMEQLNKAVDYLSARGFPKENLKTILKSRQRGISREILEEARKGYFAVVVGRRGVARIQEVLLGGTSFRLLEKLTDIPLCIVGKDTPPFDKVLLATDGSQNSLRAAEFARELCEGSSGEICIIHVIRGKDREVVEEIEANIQSIFQRTKERLGESRIGPNRLSTRIIYGAESRSLAILDVARREGYGTIVLGRKGLSATKEFFMGRVSSRIVQLAKGLSVWVVT